MNSPKQAPLKDWFGNPLPVPAPVAQPEAGVNPCIALYGPGPADQQCQGCIHLRYPHHHSKRFWKCDLRTQTRGRGSDHKVSWPACGKYEKRQREYFGG